MQLNQYEIPIIKARFVCPDRITAVSCDELEVSVKAIAENNEINFKISFPVGGGVRLCSQNKGFFEPENGLKRIVSNDNRLFKTEDGMSLEICQGRDSFSFVFSLEGERSITVSSKDILIGLDGDNWIKSAFKRPLKEQERIYGFGERFNTLNHRGTDFTLWNVDCWSKGNSAYKNMPIFHSTEGYMAFFNSMYSCYVDVGLKQEDVMSLEFEGPKWDCYFFLSSPTENIKQYTSLTGKPIMPPDWAFRYWAGGGYQVWEEKGQDKYLEVLSEFINGYKALGIDNLAALFGEGLPFHNEPAYRLLDETKTRMLAWNHPSLMIDEMKEMLKTDKLDEIPYFKNPENPELQAHREVIDFTHYNAKKVVSEFFKQYWDWGLKGCMVDYGEILPQESLCSLGLYGNEMHNFVSYWYNKTYHDAWSERLGEDYILFSRSSCAGCQKWLANFGGDQVSTFEGLRQAFCGMLNFTACGFTFWGTDIGGYGGPPGNEVYTRWLQFGTFNPIMRAHGAGGDRNPWSYGEKAVEVFCRFYALRENLIPLILSAAVNSHLTGEPMTKQMSLAFPKDNEALKGAEQFMFCNELLVCPVLEEGIEQMSVVIPKGEWYDIFSGSSICGGEHKIDISIDTIPVYIRSGSMIPIKLSSSLDIMDKVGDTSKDGFIITVPQEKRNVRIYQGRESSRDITLLPLNENSFEISSSDVIDTDALLVYGAIIEKVMLNGKEINADIENTGKGYCRIKLNDTPWETLTAVYRRKEC